MALIENLVRFYWPIAMVIVYLAIFHQRIQARAAFGVMATLTLFGMSRLMSTEILPLAVGLLNPPLDGFWGMISQLHWATQIVTAVGGWFVIHWLSRYFRVTCRWNQTSKSWESSDSNVEKSRGKVSLYCRNYFSGGSIEALIGRIRNGHREKLHVK